MLEKLSEEVTKIQVNDVKIMSQPKCIYVVCKLSHETDFLVFAVTTMNEVAHFNLSKDKNRKN